MEATGSEITPPRSTRENGTAEDNHDDSIDNENDSQELQKSTLTMSPKKGKGLVDRDDVLQLINIDIPALVDQVKARKGEIARLDETVQQLDERVQQLDETVQQVELKVDKQSQEIEDLKKRLRRFFSSWESIWKKNEEDGPDDENPSPSIAGPSSTKRVPAIKDVTKSSLKRGRPSKQDSDQDKKAKISAGLKSNDEGIENKALDQEEVQCSSATILDLTSSSSAINVSAVNGKEDVSEDSGDEVEDTSFVPFKKYVE